VFDRTYVASRQHREFGHGSRRSNPASSLGENTTGSIYAGSPRAFVAGMKVAFK